MFKKILFITINILAISPVFSARIEQRMYKDAISLGMGGVGVTTFGYQFSAIRNPAALGLMADHDIAPFLTLGASFSPQVVDILNSPSPSTIDYNSLINSAPSLNLNGPLNLGYMGKGFGIWTTTSASLQTAFMENTNNFLHQNGISPNLNNMSQAGFELLDMYNSGEPLNSDKLIDIFNRHIKNDLLQQGLTPEEVNQVINQLAQDIMNDPEGTEHALGKYLPKAKADFTAEITINAAYAYKIAFSSLDDVSGLSLGATVRFAQRFAFSSGKELTSVDQLANSFNNMGDSLYQASIISSDFGASLRIENFILGVTVRDALSTKFVWKDFANNAVGIEDSYIPYSVDFGGSYRFYFNNTWIQEIGLYVEFEDMTSTYSSWLNKLRIGSEFKLFNFLDLRLGMYDGFITGGVGMGWKWFRVDFAYYREKYLDYFTSDNYYVNMTLGLDNSPQRKARSIQKQLEQDKIQARSIELLNNSLEGI